MSCQPCDCDPEAYYRCADYPNCYVGKENQKLRSEVFQPGALPSKLTSDFSKPLPKDEVRITDPKTGGQKGSKLARFALIPMDALWAVAEHFGLGARKYEDRNWERGYRWSLSYDALLRHLALDMQGQERDEETGSLHIVAVAWHALVLVAFRLRGIGTDDRKGRTE